MGYKLLEKMAWVDARDAFKQTKLAIIPVGSVEQHGPHMPLGTDFWIADHLAKLVAPRVDGVVTPVIPVGYAEYHTDFPGSLSVSRQTLATYITELCDCLIRYGVTHIIFVDGHGGNIVPLDMVGQHFRLQGIPVATFVWWEIAPDLNPEWSPNGHGDKIEASLVLACDPEGVYMDRAKVPVNKKLTPKIQVLDGSNCQFGRSKVKIALRIPEVSDTGNILEYGLNATADYTVSPAEATAELGHEIFAALADYFVEFAAEFVKVKLPPVK